jgi:general secretion pathway protein G
MMRRAFTMIELLIVIVVLTLLVGMLLPAVKRAYNRAEEAAVAAEMNSIEIALAAFKNRYGAYPPSRVVIAEDGDYSVANLGPTMVKLAPRSLGYLRRFWPRMKLSTDGSKPAIPGGWYDVNGDHIKNKPYVVDGRECLVVFLGGVLYPAGDGWTMSGLDRNPANPFTSAVAPPIGKTWPYGTNRDEPLHTFDAGRLAASGNPTLSTGDGPLLAYRDVLGSFLVYFSAYEGAGYDPDDVNVQEEDEAGTPAYLLGAFATANAATPTLVNGAVSSPAPNPYTIDTPLPTDANGKIVNDPRHRVYYDESKFQLISAGLDGLYGIGGQWKKEAADPLPFWAQANSVITGQTFSNMIRNRERDNVTSFAKARLD